MREINSSTALSILGVIFVVTFAVGRASLPSASAVAPAGVAGASAPEAAFEAAPAAPSAPAASQRAAAPAPKPAPRAAAPPPKAPATPPAAKKSADKVWRVRLSKNDASRGPKNAPVTLVVFTAFGCPECSEFKPHLDRLMEQEPYKSKVRVVFKHKVMPSPHPDALLASQAALAAGAQMKFWQMHDKLFANSFDIDRGALEGYAREIKLKMGPFKKALDRQTYRAQVLRDTLLAYEVAAHSFPNIIANGVRIKKPKNYDSLKTLVDGQIARADNELAAGTPRAKLYEKLTKDGKFFPQIGASTIRSDPSGSPALGPASAKVTVTVYEDFECPFCARIGPNLKAFQKQHPKDVRVVYKHLPLTSIHPNAQLAGEASMAADKQGKFWEYHDVLYRNQKALARDQLLEYAQQVGLNADTFNQDLNTGAGKSLISRDVREARGAGITGTPSVFINGRKYQGPPGYPAEGLEAVATVYFGLGTKP